MKELTRIVVVGLVVSVGVVSSAQSQQLERRFFVSLDGGFQSGQQQFQDRRTTADVYGEDQITDTDYDIDRSAGLLRVNVTARLRESIGFGFGFTRSVSTGNADVTVAVPSPLFVNRPRVVSTDLSTLGHRENMYHFQAVWIVPLDERVQLQLFAGPSLMKIDQAVVTGVITTEVGSPFTSVTLADVVVTEVAETSLGFNVGLDFSYMLGENYGFGGFVQYAGGSVDLGTGADATSLTVGGIQFGVGLRLSM